MHRSDGLGGRIGIDIDPDPVVHIGIGIHIMGRIRMLKVNPHRVACGRKLQCGDHSCLSVGSRGHGVMVDARIVKRHHGEEIGIGMCVDVRGCWWVCVEKIGV